MWLDVLVGWEEREFDPQISASTRGQDSEPSSNTLCHWTVQE